MISSIKVHIRCSVNVNSLFILHVKDITVSKMHFWLVPDQWRQPDYKSNINTDHVYKEFLAIYPEVQRKRLLFLSRRIEKGPMEEVSLKQTSNYRWKWKWSCSVCLTLCNPIDCNLPCSSIRGIFQARILEWVAISSPRRSSWPRDWTQVSRVLHCTQTLYHLSYQESPL